MPENTHLRRFLLTLILACAATLSACQKPEQTLSDAVRNLTFYTLTGDTLSLATIEEPVLVNFWATDCAICIHEMPELAEVYRHYQPLGFTLVAVAMPYDAPNHVLEMAEREQWPFPVALDITGEAVKSFESVKGTPTSYLLDENGKLVERYIGAIPIDKLRLSLDQLVAN